MSLDEILDTLADRVADRVAQRLGTAPTSGGYLTTRATAELLGLAVDTVAEKCASGDIPAVRLPGGRTWLIRPSDLETVLSKSTGGGSACTEPAPAAPVDLRAARLAAAVRGKGRRE